MNPSSKQLIQQVLGLLAIRDRSTLEIRQFLGKKTQDQALIDQVIHYLEDKKLIDDAKFGQQWLHARIRRLKGDRLVSQELTQKGLNKELSVAIISQVDTTAWFEAMDELVAKKASRLQSLTGYQKRAKTYQILAQRGFSSQLIDAFLRAKVE